MKPTRNEAETYLTAAVAPALFACKTSTTYAPPGVMTRSHQQGQKYHSTWGRKIRKDRLTPIPLMNKHTRFKVSPIGPETYFVIRAEARIGNGRNAPKKAARRRSSGYQYPRISLYLMTTLSDSRPESGAPTEEEKERQWRSCKRETYVSSYVHCRYQEGGSINQ